MKAVIACKGSLSVEETERPIPGPGEVLVKTLACGICGSDLHALKNSSYADERAAKSGGIANGDVNLPMVPGHEFCAEVVEYGPDTTGAIPVGTRVCAEPILLKPDGKVEAIGFSNNTPGGYGQFMVLFEGLLVPVPDNLSSEEAALTEPLAVGIHAVNRAEPAVDDGAIVIGCGPVGLAIIADLKRRNITPIVASDPSPMRRDLASQMGADLVLDPRERPPYEAYRELATTSPDKAAERPIWLLGPTLKRQLVFESVGVPGILQEIFENAEPNATVVVAGVCMAADTIEPIFAINKQLDVRFVFGQSVEEFQLALQLLADGTTAFNHIVSRTCGLAEVPRMFEELEQPECHAKVIIDPWQDSA